MHIQVIIACVCSLLTESVLAAPHVHKRSFTVERVPNPNFTGRSGPGAVAKAYRKYGMALPDNFMTKRQQASSGYLDELLDQAEHHGGGMWSKGGKDGDKQDDQTNGDGGDNYQQSAGGASNSGTSGAQGQAGSVTATPENNEAEFISPVTVGGQTLNIDFDTGSSDFWVFNTQLGAASTAGHQVFNPAKSQTFKQMSGAQFSISYGDGSGAKGIVGTDTVQVGGVSFAAQAVELATTVSQSFAQDQTSDGLMGLAFSNINNVQPQKQKTFLDNVKSSLAEPVFTANLRGNSPGTYTFGSIDQSKFQGALTWVPVNNAQGFWQFGSEKFAVGGGQTQAATAGGQAIADTGTSLILADQTIVTAYYAQVQGAQNNAQQGGFVFPCDAKLPDLALDVGGVYMATVSGSDMVFAELGDGSKFHPPPSLLNILPQSWCEDHRVADMAFQLVLAAFNPPLRGSCPSTATSSSNRSLLPLTPAITAWAWLLTRKRRN